jgi:hypothetical protein
MSCSAAGVISKSCLAGAYGGDEEAVAVSDVDGLGALDALDQDLDVAIGHFDALHDVADRADLVDVLGLGLVDGGVVLGGEKDLAIAAECLFERTHAGLAAHHEGRHHIGEDDHIADGHHGQLARLVFFAGHGHQHTWLVLALAVGSNCGAGRRDLYGLYSQRG